MRMVTLISSFLITLIFFSSCNSSPSGPEITIDPEPGSRNYEWTVDTLNMPMNYIGTIWGASPDDVWAMGAGGTYADRLLHYDGSEWQTYTKEPILFEKEVFFCIWDNSGPTFNNVVLHGKLRGAGN